MNKDGSIQVDPTIKTRAEKITPEPLIVPRNKNERLQIQFKEYQGHEFVDMRVFYLGDDDTWKHTHKGITIPLASWLYFYEKIGTLNRKMIEERAIK